MISCSLLGRECESDFEMRHAGSRRTYQLPLFRAVRSSHKHSLRANVHDPVLPGLGFVVGA